MEVQRLPLELLYLILKRMDFVAFYRFRRTNKRMDSFAEQNRFRLSIRDRKMSKILLFSASKDEEPRLQISVITAFSHWKLWNHNFYYDTLKTSILSDPFKQISGLRFDAVDVKFIYPLQERHVQSLLEDEILSLLRRLFLVTEKLYVSNLIKLTDVLDCVRFSGIMINREVNWIDLEGQSLKHWSSVLLIQMNYLHNEHPYANEISAQIADNCTDFVVYTIQDVPSLDRLMAFVSRFSFASLHFGSNTIKSILLRFLEEIRDNQATKGKLKKLRLRTCNIADQEGPFTVKEAPFLEQIWHGEDEIWPFDHQCFYKMRICGGYALLKYNWVETVIYFVEDANRQTLFEKLAPEMFWAPVDFSVGYEEFLAAPSDQEAFSKLKYP